MRQLQSCGEEGHNFIGELVKIILEFNNFRQKDRSE